VSCDTSKGNKPFAERLLAVLACVTRLRYSELFPLVEKIGGGILKADAMTSVITANVVKHCVWLLQRLQVADIAANLSSNLLSGCFERQVS
jgi:hypothetical protein